MQHLRMLFGQAARFVSGAGLHIRHSPGQWGRHWFSGHACIAQYTALVFRQGALCWVQIEKHVRWLWRFIMMPILFGLIGDAMRFNSLQKNSIAKACGIIFAGWTPLTFSACGSIYCKGVLICECLCCNVTMSVKQDGLLQ